MDSIQAQRDLSEKDLMIFNAELQRRSKSVGLTYILWLFLGGFGIHNFYMGKALWGGAYLVLGILGWTFFLSGLFAGVFSAQPASVATETAVFGTFSLGVLGLLLLWDLFTIPWQLARREELIKKEILDQLCI